MFPDCQSNGNHRQLDPEERLVIPSHLKEKQKGAHGDIKTWIYELDICDEAVREVLLKEDFSNDSIIKCDVFGEVLKKEECIWTDSDDNNVSTTVQTSLFQVNKVLKRQYSTISGGHFSLRSLARAPLEIW